MYALLASLGQTCFENSWGITNTQRAGWVLRGAEAWRQGTDKAVGGGWGGEQSAWGAEGPGEE